uniref:T7 class I MHC gene exon 5 n=1 Tax=Mus musculus TaxID=10090 RepID=Q31236_MOUSE|nr:unnamed protein product [Mus musculus]
PPPSTLHTSNFALSVVLLAVTFNLPMVVFLFVYLFLVGWLVCWFWFFETGFLCVALAVLKLTL